MAMPEVREFYDPVFDVIAEFGEALKSPKIRVEVAKRLQLTAEDLAQMPPVSPTGVFKNRVAHALKNLQHYDFIVGRGIDGEGKRYRVTAAGRERRREQSLADLSDPDDRISEAPGSGADPWPGSQEVPDGEHRVTANSVHSQATHPRRPFDPDASVPGVLAQFHATDPDSIQQKTERARRGHHDLLVNLYRSLSEDGWSQLEWDRSVDLWGVSPEGKRAIFEAKTIDDNEATQLRGALSQLIDYRYLHGRSDDLLAVVVDRPVDCVRAEILSSVGVALLVCADQGFRPANDEGRHLLG